MSIIIIPRQLVKEKELVLIPKKEYDELLSFKKLIKTVKSTAEEKRIIAQGRRAIKSGDFTRWEDLKKEMSL